MLAWHERRVPWDNNTMDTDMPRSRLFLLYLMFTAVACGALVMVVEILGSRVIGPFFGVGLFVWTSLIAVTLLALALGYWLGGHWSDHNDHPDRLYLIILVSGLLVLAIPPLKAPVLQLCLPLGLRLGAFSSALILFGPSLFLLGCVSPYLVKIATREFHLLGRTVGRFYALSTLGSVAGTAFAGFFLIGYLGVNHIFQLTGGLLIAIAVAYFAVFRRRVWPLALLALPLLPLHLDAPVEKRLVDGTLLQQVAVRDSYYGQIRVVDYRYQQQHVRDLMIDGLTQGGIDMRNGLPLYEYPYLLQFVPRQIHPQGHRGLMIGLGAGMIPAWYERQGVTMDVVEIDPVVAAIAREYFGLRLRGDVHLADARYFLSTTERRYDYVLLDVFNGDLTPGHLISLEAFGLVERLLNPGGVFALNLITDLSRDPAMTAAVVATLRRLFDQVDLYPTANLRIGGRPGNLIAVAYDGPPRRADASLLASFPVYPPIARDVALDLATPLALPVGADALVLTDDYNPIDVFDAQTREAVRLGILRNSEMELLLD